MRDIISAISKELNYTHETVPLGHMEGLVFSEW